MRAYLPILAGLLAALSARSAELFRDDFSRFAPGWLTSPVGQLNAAIQEYHYLPHRGVPLAPWANAICHMDAWVAGEEDGKPYVEQHLPPDHRTMIPRLFSPIFLTGEPEWHDYAVEVSVRPLSAADMAGLVFRYHTNRHHYLFCLQNGKQARLALRLPLEKDFRVADWKELGTVDFPYDDTRWYRLKVENQGPAIRAYIDGKLVLKAESPDLPSGKAGLAATNPARFQDFRVTVAPETRKAIDDRIRQRNDELAKLQADNPDPCGISMNAGNQADRSSGRGTSCQGWALTRVSFKDVDLAARTGLASGANGQPGRGPSWPRPWGRSGGGGRGHGGRGWRSRWARRRGSLSAAAGAGCWLA